MTLALPQDVFYFLNCGNNYFKFEQRILNPMKTNNLLASVALFSELYNSKHYENITDIIAEFIKAVVVSEGKWSTTPSEISDLLERVYGFRIPEAVIKSTVRNRLKTVAQNIGGMFHFDNMISKDFEKIDAEYASLKEIQLQIKGELFDFINGYRKEPLSENEKMQIEDNFHKFLMDNGFSEKYTDQISGFVIKNSKNSEFKKNLNLIREGIILYQGIRYSSDLNVFGVWNTDLKIFLGSEHLLSSLGFNGILYRELFEDFYKLVNEINQSNKNRGSEKRIILKYFSESVEDIESLFYSAEQIISGKSKLIGQRTAMKEILNGCKNPSDIVNKKVLFYQSLKQMGITVQDFKEGELYKYPDYNVEDGSVIELLRKESIEKIGHFDEVACHRIFKIFTKVNYFRGGENRDKFENIGFIYITNSGLARYLAHNNNVKFEEKDIPFAKDIDYITNKFWFKLRKGLSTNQDFPKSLDVVTKAQIVLSSHMQNSIINHYEKLKQELKSNKLTEEAALEINHNLREKSNKPEDITVETLDSSLAFLLSDDIFQEIILEKERKDQLLIASQRRIVKLQHLVDTKNAEELAQKLSEKRKLLETEKSNFMIDKWQIETRHQNLNSLRFLAVLAITVGPIILGLFLKVFDSFTIPVHQWDSKTTYFWICTVLVYLIELLGRSYLFNKEKIKLGWNWITFLIMRNDFRLFKEAKHNEFETEFESDLEIKNKSK